MSSTTNSCLSCAVWCAATSSVKLLPSIVNRSVICHKQQMRRKRRRRRRTTLVAWHNEVHSPVHE
jgi:hypothetical protein